MFKKIYSAIFGNINITIDDSAANSPKQTQSNEEDKLSKDLEEFKKFFNNYYKTKEENKKQEALKHLNRAKLYVNIEKQEADNFAPDLKIEHRKYGDFLIISNTQFASKNDPMEFVFTETESKIETSYEEIRLDSIASVVVNDYNKIDEDYFSTDNDAVYDTHRIGIQYGHIVQKMLDDYPNPSLRLRNYLSDYFNANRFSKEELMHSYDHPSIYIIPFLETTVYIETKFGKSFHITCSTFVVEKVLAAIDQILKTGKYDPKKYIGEK